MRIPIWENGNIVRYDDVPIIPNQVIDFNRIKDGNIAEVVDIKERNNMVKDINLGVNRVVPSNKAYWKGKRPENVL